MAGKIKVGGFVTVRGVTYKVSNGRTLNHLGSKSWGRAVFTLTPIDGRTGVPTGDPDVEWYGKAGGGQPTNQSKLFPVVGAG